MNRNSYLTYLIGSLVFFGGLALIVGGAIALILYVHWALAILWVVLTGSPFTAFIMRATDQ